MPAAVRRRAEPTSPGRHRNARRAHRGTPPAARPRCLVGSVVGAVAFGLYRAGRTAVLRPRPRAGIVDEPAVDAPAEPTASRGGRAGDAAAVLQRVLRAVPGDPAYPRRRGRPPVAGVAHVEVDAEHHLDLVRRLGVLRTPTVLVLDPQGRITRRAPGRPAGRRDRGARRRARVIGRGGAEGETDVSPCGWWVTPGPAVPYPSAHVLDQVPHQTARGRPVPRDHLLVSRPVLTATSAASLGPWRVSQPRRPDAPASPAFPPTPTAGVRPRPRPPGRTTATPAGIDPRGPRFAAALTAVVLAAVLLTGPVWLLAVQAVLFAIGAFAGPGAQPYAWLFRPLVRPRLGPPAELEDPRPPRFAQAVGLGFARRRRWSASWPAPTALGWSPPASPSSRPCSTRSSGSASAARCTCCSSGSLARGSPSRGSADPD